MTELSSRRKTYRKSFSCPVLRRPARTKEEYLEIEHGLKRSLVTFDCDDKEECGVMSWTSDRSADIDWSRCPRYKQLEPKRPG